MSAAFAGWAAASPSTAAVANSKVYMTTPHLIIVSQPLALQLRFSSFEMSAARLSLVSASPE